jgi:hypothetical protein
MKKFIVFFVSILVVANICNATLSCTLKATAGVGAADGINPISVGSRVDLVWTLLQDYETPVVGGIPSAPTPGVTSTSWGSDYLLNSWAVTTPGSLPDDGTYTYTDSLVGSQNIEAGYIYLVIYNATATPVLNTWYRESGFKACTDTVVGDPPPLTTFDIAPATPFFANQAQVAAVPEPSTIGLLLVGAGLVAFRRMRRS